MLKLAVFVSGGGSNFQAIIDAVNSRELNAEIVLAVSSNPDAFALSRAEKNNIESYVMDYSQTEEEVFDRLCSVLKEKQAEFLVLAGFMRVLPPYFVAKFRKKIINIHPSLLPKYGGKGFYGERVHSAVIASKDTLSGATVHFVDEGVDTGEIVDSISVPVFPTDSPKDLAARILSEEHILIVRALKKLIDKEGVN